MEIPSDPAAGAEIPPNPVVGAGIPPNPTAPCEDDDEAGPHLSDLECGPRSYPGHMIVLKFQLRPVIPSEYFR